MGPRASAAVVCALGAAVSAGRAHAGGFAKGPYLQDATPTSVRILWEGANAPAHVVVRAPGVEKRLDVSAQVHQEVTIDGLAPAHRYRYEVQVGDLRATGELVTAPAPGSPEPMTFVVFGDSRVIDDAHRLIVERVRSDVPDFILETGDMVDDGAASSEWQTFFEVEAPLLRDNVLWPALGNHDRQGGARTADAYRALFAVPDDGPDPERVYAFTWGQARFLILDSNASSFALDDQTAWIERELAAAHQDAKVKQIFVVMHHPPFSISLHGGQRDLRERWTPLFEKYGVTAVFSGHDHCYERALVGGVHYFVSGGGGASLYPRSRRPNKVDRDAVSRYERVSHYLRVHVIGDLVEVTAVAVDGSPIETIAWGQPPAPEVAPSGLAQDKRDVALGAPSPAIAAGVPTPVKRGPGMTAIAIVALLVVAAAVGLWWLTRDR